jgi:hypothetical protein
MHAKHKTANGKRSERIAGFLTHTPDPAGSVRSKTHFTPRLRRWLSSLKTIIYEKNAFLVLLKKLSGPNPGGLPENILWCF